ncbi:hypothetical protein KGF56_003296 [Candida oxycetoniae]|uniref:Major facilitator superfamily (MFS) profile domain-containing protein n=1 Tax=Candida oxycetoniae TaxID=497107 RepID=A0AAI9WX25_9ASCO|nr:uncharacterized protein KGF56_003296 [Candida oxycetoniae]KAI3403866.1 hypothetical protein KGF56_003296 [Candida oxycetoniae]
MTRELRNRRTRLGIRQPDARDVTGTIIMLDEGIDEDEAHSMKKSTTGVILNPQPHDSPNDPLNWSVWKRDLCLFIIGFASFLGGGMSPLLAAGMNTLVVEFNKPLTTISYLVGGFMLSLGCGSVIASPTAVLYGKRLVYIAGTFIFMMGAIWGGAAKSFGSLMGARVLTGIGASPTECLPSATIAEIYFAHERAYRVGLYTMLMLGGKNIIPLLSGLVFQNLNRHWLFWILAMFLGATLIGIILFVPDTFWDRTPTPSKRSLEETKAAQNVASYHPPSQRPNAFALHRPSQSNFQDIYSLPSSLGGEFFKNIEEEKPIEITEPAAVALSVEHKKNSWWDNLKIWHGRYTKDSWWMVALRPFVLYSYPHVLFGSITYALAVVWLIVISETISEIFRHPPYGYDQQTVGLFYISPFVGGILGSLSCGLISDRISRILVSVNKGVYEPEFRLVMIIPSTIFIVIGLMGYGWSSTEQDPWIAPVLFFGSLAFGSSIASTTAITFAVDSYKVFAAETLVSFNFLKNFLGFCFSLFNNKYADAQGYKNAYVTYGGIQLFVSLFAIPLYIYGKKSRRWTDEKELMRSLYHEDNIPPSVSLKSKYDNDSDAQIE